MARATRHGRGADQTCLFGVYPPCGRMAASRDPQPSMCPGPLAGIGQRPCGEDIGRREEPARGAAGARRVLGRTDPRWVSLNGGSMGRPLTGGASVVFERRGVSRTVPGFGSASCVVVSVPVSLARRGGGKLWPWRRSLGLGPRAGMRWGVVRAGADSAAVGYGRLVPLVLLGQDLIDGARSGGADGAAGLGQLECLDPSFGQHPVSKGGH